MAAIGSPPPARSARLGLRATPEQEAVLRRAAEVSHKSLTDFILDSACLAAEQALLDQRLFMVSGSQAQALIDLLDRPEQATRDSVICSPGRHPGTPSDLAAAGAAGRPAPAGRL